MQDDVRRQGRIEELLAQARDLLLDWNRAALQASVDEERSRARRLYAIAEGTENLRRHVVEIREAGSRSPIDEAGVLLQNSEENDGLEAHESMRRPKDDYPKFFREGINLLKVGLTKDEKREYKHRVPKPDFRRVVDAITAAGGDGNEFTAETIKKMLGNRNKYHVDATLALLRRKKAVVLVRRGTYKVGATPLDVVLEDIWSSLPEENHQ